jgi:hypothetical protein
MHCHKKETGVVTTDHTWNHYTKNNIQTLKPLVDGFGGNRFIINNSFNIRKADWHDFDIQTFHGLRVLTDPGLGILSGSYWET